MSHRTINQLLACAACIGFVWALGVLGPSLDAPHNTDDLNDAMRAAKADMRKNLASAQQCADEFGPNAQYAYTPDGVLVCKSKHSKQVASK